MDIEARKKLKDLLIQHEQYRQFPYTDSTGHLTIGIGRNISTRGISSSEALQLLDDDIFYFSSKLSHLIPFFDTLDNVRQIVLIDMCFNLGINGILEFKDMLAALERKDFIGASSEISNSKAAAQDVNRYEQLAYIMKTGEL
jgi:lysozyme